MQRAIVMVCGQLFFLCFSKKKIRKAFEALRMLLKPILFAIQNVVEGGTTTTRKYKTKKK